MYVKNAKLTMTDGDSAVAGRRVNVVALFCDLRGFSNWCETVDISQVESLMRTQFERVIQICNDHHHDFHKFLGDGFVLLWEESAERPLHLCLAFALDAAFHLHKKYWFLSQDEDHAIPSGYGIGISVGEAVLLQPETFLAELNEVDFVGYPLNCAARLQTLANAYGTVLCSATVSLIESDLRALLYESEPAFRRLLLPPEEVALKRASAMKGLRDRDRTGFRHLVFEGGYRNLWKTMGLATAS
jgi:class 3 adenylate cyclase